MDDLGGPSPPHNVHLKGADGYCFTPQIKSVCMNNSSFFHIPHYNATVSGDRLWPKGPEPGLDNAALLKRKVPG